MLQKVRRELAVWMDLRHKNIVPFVGVAYGLEGEKRENTNYFPAILSLRMMNGMYTTSFMFTSLMAFVSGDLVDFLKKGPDCDMEDLPLQIARGLDYLHRELTTIIFRLETQTKTFSEYDIIHGDLKAVRSIIWLFDIL